MIHAAAESAKRDGQAVEAGTPLADWLAWAAQQADRLDPLKESPPSIIDAKAPSKQAVSVAATVVAGMKQELSAPNAGLSDPY